MPPRAENALSYARSDFDLDVNILSHFDAKAPAANPLIDIPRDLCDNPPMSAEAVLDKLLSDPLITPPEGPQGTPQHWPSGASRGIAKVRYTHDAMIDLIIQEPSISQNALAAHFGYSASWISQVISSDAFQTKLAARSEELIDPVIKASIEERFKGLVLRSLEILSEKLSKRPDEIPDQLAIKTLEIASKAAGYGLRERAAPIQVNMEVHLAQMGERMTQLLQRKREAIDAPHVEEISQEAPGG